MNKRTSNAAPKKANRKIGAESAKAMMQGQLNPVRNMSAPQLLQMLDQFDAGYLRPLARVMDQIERRDDTMMTVAPKRKKAVARYGYEILTVDIDPKDKKLKKLAAQQHDALTFFYNNLTATSVLEQDQVGGASLLFRQMMDAVGQRYAIHEIEWEKRGPFYTATFWKCPLSFFEATTGRLRFIRDPFGMTGEEMNDGEWLVTVGEGLSIVCAILCFFKNKPRNAWVRFCDKFGMPGVHGETDASFGSKEWKDMVAAVTNFINDWSMVTSTGQKINLIEAKGGTGNMPHPPLMEALQRAIVMLWRGGDLGTMSKGDAVGALAQAEESDVLEQDDALMLSETLNIKVDRKVIEYTFGPNVPLLVYIKILTKDRQNIDQELKIDEFLLKHKFPLPLSGVSERYGRPIPEAGEILLAAAEEPATKKEDELEETKAKNDAVRRISDGLGVPTGWVTPITDLVARIDQMVDDPEVTDAELLAFFQECQARLPELLGGMDTEALVAALEPAFGQAALDGIRAAVARTPKPLPAPQS